MEHYDEILLFGCTVMSGSMAGLIKSVKVETIHTDLIPDGMASEDCVCIKRTNCVLSPSLKIYGQSLMVTVTP